MQAREDVGGKRAYPRSYNQPFRLTSSCSMPPRERADSPRSANGPERLIGERIKEQRERLAMNFEELAALTRELDSEGHGISAVTLRRYERDDDGATVPGIREVRILCATFDVSADYLIRGIATDGGPLDQMLDELFELLSRLRKPRRRGDVNAVFSRQEAIKRAKGEK